MEIEANYLAGSVSAEDQGGSAWGERSQERPDGHEETVMRYLPLVRRAAEEAHARWASSAPIALSQEDLVQEGVLGLLGALDVLDPRDDTPLSGYRVARRVRATIRSALHRSRGSERLSGPLPGDPGVGIAGYGPYGSDGNGEGGLRPAISPVQAPGGISASAEEEALPSVNVRDLERAVRGLPERYGRVLVERYGLFGGEVLTLRAIAEREGVCAVAVWEREKRAERRLSEALARTVGGTGAGGTRRPEQTLSADGTKGAD